MTALAHIPFPAHPDQQAMPEPSAVNDDQRDTWTILRVTPLMERKVAAALGPKTDEHPYGAGLTVYVPIEKYRPANHWRARTRPLIPGYVFADLPDDDSLDTARENYAVRDVMCHDDGIPFRLSADVIGALILFEAWRVFDRTWRPPPFRAQKRGGRKVSSYRETKWEHGKRVRILDGPFAGFLGTVMATPRDLRINVVTAIFGRQTTIELGEDEVEAAQEGSAR
jgi:transcription antitermination factor NusG